MHKKDPQFQAILMDMDGVLYHGKQAVDGAIEFVRHVQHQQIPCIFITNNPIRKPADLVLHLQALGFDHINNKQILTSAEVTAEKLAMEKPGFHYFAVGGKGLHEALQKQGIEDHQKADFVVIGEGEGLDYSTLTTGINLIKQQGARLICTNPDESVDTIINGQRQILAGGGALVAPFAVATGEKPVFIGKPYPGLYQQALLKLGLQAQECLMIGDRPDTDILGAARLGMLTALVRTGRFGMEKPLPDNCPTPDFDVENLTVLAKLLGLSE